MAEAETQPVGTDEPEHEGTQEDRIDALEGKVDVIGQKIDQILGLGHKPEQPTEATPEAEAPGVAAEVRAELAKLKQAEDRKKARESQAKDIDELKETVKKIRERPPKEYRKVTNMVWGRDED